MLPADIDQITEQDLQDLVTNSVLEKKSLEYKQSLPGASDAEKKEFLADISSFANASGGDILFGVSSDNTTGTPQALNGINIPNVDLEISRLDSSIRDGIEPRIQGFVIKPITLASSNVVFLVRVQRSWNPPHRVTFKGHDKFYSRSTNGKYPLDVDELRIAFNLSASIAERIRNFRIDRVSKILSDEGPLPLLNNPKIVLHIVPVISFNPAQSFDFSRIVRDPAQLSPLYSGGTERRYNIDGFLTYSVGQAGRCQAYAQLFKNGIIETADATMFQPLGERLSIPSTLFERELISTLSNYLALLRELGVQLPAYVFLSLLGVQGYTMAVNRIRYRILLIDRQNLLITEATVERYETLSEDILQPCFDSVWNASGYPRSPNYDEAGNWVPQ